MRQTNTTTTQVISNGTAGKRRKPAPFSPYTVLSHLAVALSSFQMGLLFGGSSSSSNNHPSAPAASNAMDSPPLHRDMKKVECEPTAASNPAAASATTTASSDSSPVFPLSMTKFVSGAALVDRNDFVQTHDFGMPWDLPKPGNNKVLLLYNHPTAKPDKTKAIPQTSATAAEERTQLPVYSAANATENCHVLQVALIQPDVKNQCLAIVGQWQSFHIHKLMRLGESDAERKEGVHAKHALRYVSRSHATNGRMTHLPAGSMLTKSFGTALAAYITTLPATLERLRPIAEQVAGGSPSRGGGNGNRAIVVLVCNFGQSELLMNFVCSARARQLDLSRILLFATDEDIVGLAKGLGIAVFEVQDAFGDLPTEAARGYGDKIFAGMMMAKVYCVHLISLLGYDLLFQDVDVVWYKNPLPFFENTKESGNYDIYFQDDGARSMRYSPYSPNSGFYFVRHNERTEYLFSVFSRMGDLIQQSGSHQAALTSLMSEHASWRGLQIKVFGRDDALGMQFPGGFHYHQRRAFMKEFALGQHAPYIFHMSWTKNKDNKRKYYQQMNDWYVKDKCTNKRLGEIEDLNDPDQLEPHCCTTEPLFQCHYRDKPSKTECKSSPPIDKGRPSFW